MGLEVGSLSWLLCRALRWTGGQTSLSASAFHYLGQMPRCGVAGSPRPVLFSVATASFGHPSDPARGRPFLCTQRLLLPSAFSVVPSRQVRGGLAVGWVCISQMMLFTLLCRVPGKARESRCCSINIVGCVDEVGRMALVKADCEQWGGRRAGGSGRRRKGSPAGEVPLGSRWKAAPSGRTRSPPWKAMCV